MKVFEARDLSDFGEGGSDRLIVTIEPYNSRTQLKSETGDVLGVWTSYDPIFLEREQVRELRNALTLWLNDD